MALLGQVAEGPIHPALNTSWADFERAHRDYNPRQDSTSDKIPLLPLSLSFGAHLEPARELLFIQTWTEDVLQKYNSLGHHSVKDSKPSVPTASHHRTKIFFLSHFLLLLDWVFHSVMEILKTWTDSAMSNLLLLAMLWAEGTDQGPPEVLSSLNSVFPLLVSHIKYVLSEKTCIQCLSDVSQNFLSHTR